MSRANFVQVQLAAAATDTQTTLSVKAPVGGFKAPPVDGGRLVLTDSPGRPMAFEVITYTGRTGTGPYTLTGVTRGLEGTVGLAWGIDTFAMMTLTVAEFDAAIQAAIDGLTAADIPALDASKITTGVLAAARIPTLNQDTTGSAARLTTARTINGTSFNGTADITTQKWGTSRSLVFTGDVSGGASVDGSTAVAFAMTLANSGVTAGTYPKVTVDAKGRVTGGAALSASDIPSLDASKIVSGTLNAARIPTLNQNTAGSAGALARKDTRSQDPIPAEYENDGVTYHFKYNATTGFTAGGGTYHRLLNLDAWVGTSGGLSSQLAFGDNGAVGIRTATSDTVWGPWHTFYTTANKPTAADVGLGNVDNIADNEKSVLSAAKLATARTIGGVSFDGSANINLPGVNVTGNQNTTGNAATATKLASIGTSFSGEYPLTINAGGVIYSHTDITFKGSTGVLTAPKFSGDGSLLTAINASALTGTIDTARLPAAALIGDTTYSAGTGLSLAGTTFSLARPLFPIGLASYSTSTADVSAAGGFSVNYLSSGATDKPTGTDHALLTMAYNSSFMFQFAGDWRTNKLYTRTKNSGVVSSWKELLTTDGDGSQLTNINASNIATGTISAARIPTLNQNTTGNAATATKLATARTIGGVSFDGTANINLPGVNTAGNQNTTGSAASLTTARSITATGDGSWTVSFNGSANVSAAFTLASTGVVAGTYPKVTVDAKGRVTAGAALVAGDLPSHGHSASDITSGVLDPARLPAEALVGDTTYSAGVGLSLSGTIFSIAPATADNPGGVRLGSDVEQTVAPVAVTSSASRTYAVQMNADQRLVVNVPWSNTTYSEISEAEITTGTASTARAISARRLTFALAGKADASHTHDYLPLAGGTVTGDVVLSSATASTSPTTGALKVTGGVGVGGAIYAAGNIGGLSDIRVKTNIEVIENALDKVDQLRGVVFDRTDIDLRQTGVIAQEVQAVLPEAVSDDGEHLTVAYGNMVGLLIEAVKELRAEVNRLKGGA